MCGAVPRSAELEAIEPLRSEAAAWAELTQSKSSQPSPKHRYLWLQPPAAARPVPESSGRRACPRRPSRVQAASSSLSCPLLPFSVAWACGTAAAAGAGRLPALPSSLHGHAPTRPVTAARQGQRPVFPPARRPPPWASGSSWTSTSQQCRTVRAKRLTAAHIYSILI